MLSLHCTIRIFLLFHDVGREDGIAYSIAELLQGDTLRERIAATAWLSLSKRATALGSLANCNGRNFEGYFAA